MAKEKTTALASVPAVPATEALTAPDGRALGWVPESEDAFAGQSVTHMVTLEANAAIRGIFEGPGDSVEMTDPSTGELREVGTWKIRVAKTVCMQFATSAQLDAKLKSYPIGAVVTIKKLPESRRSRAGRVVSQYLVSDPPASAP